MDHGIGFSPFAHQSADLVPAGLLISLDAVEAILDPDCSPPKGLPAPLPRVSFFA
jgi:hypothetical protein